MSRIRPALKLVYQTWLEMCVSWPLLADLHFCISKEFRREHRAVLAGRLAHRKARASLGSDKTVELFRLRRAIHRLEKGLIANPRRDLFGLDYIEETVRIFVEVTKEVESQNGDDWNDTAPTLLNATVLQWAEAVLQEYFNVVRSHPVTDAARRRFRECKTGGRSTSCVPTSRREYEDQKRVIPSYQELLSLAMVRRSIRWYRPTQVPRGLVRKAVAVASLSPSACNRQPFRFAVFDRAQDAQRVGALPPGTSGFAGNFPCTIVVVGDLSAYELEKDRHLIYVDAGLASMSLILALETLGLSSCCINWPDVDECEVEMARELSLAVHERPIMVISVGFADPDGGVPFSQKRSAGELIEFFSDLDGSNVVQAEMPASAR